jgi:hypothetical protein
VVIRKSSVGKMELSFETPACQDMSLGAEELNSVFGIGSCRMARKELGAAKKTSCVV